jgi:hypothetical protein
MTWGIVAACRKSPSEVGIELGSITDDAIVAALCNAPRPRSSVLARANANLEAEDFFLGMGAAAGDAAAASSTGLTLTEAGLQIGLASAPPTAADSAACTR